MRAERETASLRSSTILPGLVWKISIQIGRQRKKARTAQKIRVYTLCKAPEIHRTRKERQKLESLAALMTKSAGTEEEYAKPFKSLNTQKSYKSQRQTSCN